MEEEEQEKNNAATYLAKKKRAARLTRMGCTVAFPVGILWRAEGMGAFPECPVPFQGAQCTNHGERGGIWLGAQWEMFPDSRLLGAGLSSEDKN